MYLSYQLSLHSTHTGVSVVRDGARGPTGEERSHNPQVCNDPHQRVEEICNCVMLKVHVDCIDLIESPL